MCHVHCIGCSARGHKAEPLQSPLQSTPTALFTPSSTSQCTWPIDGDKLTMGNIHSPSQQPSPRPSQPSTTLGVCSLSLFHGSSTPLFTTQSDTIITAQQEHRPEAQKRRENLTKVKTTVHIYFWACFACYISFSMLIQILSGYAETTICTSIPVFSCRWILHADEGGVIRTRDYGYIPPLLRCPPP
jgi:hypothetical protein